MTASTTTVVRIPEVGASRCLLLVHDGVVRSMPIADRAAELAIGRGATCAIQVDEPSISRLHAVLHVGDTLAIEDSGSANGTMVRGARLAPHTRVPIALHEAVELGNVTLLVQHRTIGAAATADARVAAPTMRGLYRLIDRVAPGMISVLILGETGAGKEVTAERIHRMSPRAGRPFLRLNCAALSDTLLESELFGHERGAFTGAVQAKPGLLETADGGTVFLDEIGELPHAVQVKLLRVLEERAVLRVGGLAPRTIDVRFIAATNRDLEVEVAAGRFREDLYYRLSGVTLVVPPLRERRGEIAELATTLLGQLSARDGRPAPTLSPAALEMLRNYRWPGNVRDLRNVLERAMLMTPGTVIGVDDLPIARLAGPPAPRSEVYAAATPAPEFTPKPLPDPRPRIQEALDQAKGNQTRAAKILGVSRRTLVNWLTRYNFPRPRRPRAPPTPA